MKEEKTGCKGYHLNGWGQCDILDYHKPTLKDCKKCTHSNNYKAKKRTK